MIKILNFYHSNFVGFNGVKKTNKFQILMTNKYK